MIIIDILLWLYSVGKLGCTVLDMFCKDFKWRNILKFWHAKMINDNMPMVFYTKLRHVGLGEHAGIGPTGRRDFEKSCMKMVMAGRLQCFSNGWNHYRYVSYIIYRTYDRCYWSVGKSNVTYVTDYDFSRGKEIILSPI